MGNRLKNTYLAANNIISSLGFSSQENVDAISAYLSAIKPIEAGIVSHEPMMAGLICTSRLFKLVNENNLERYSKVEQLIILSVQDTLSQVSVNTKDSSCAMIISTTKGNIDSLRHLGQCSSVVPEESFLSHTAKSVEDFFSLQGCVSVISNACISGVSALIVADRLLQSGKYRNVIVVGVDILSHFITSGFRSFRSLSESVCIPYDLSRDGLNLGEACGSILLTTDDFYPDTVIFRAGAISNDANHISGPSRTGDGLHHAISEAMHEANVIPSDISFVNLHGTATVYNDEMEAKAVHLSHLEAADINSLKPYFGHTLGASGVIETIVCMYQLLGKQVFGTPNYTENGVSRELKVSAKHKKSTESVKTCIKTASGFGGCNAAIVLSLEEGERLCCKRRIGAKEVNSCCVANNSIRIKNEVVFESQAVDYHTFIRRAYKNLDETNPKFYKMDDLSKLGYVAAAYLLQQCAFEPKEIGIVLSNRSSSLDTDSKFQRIIDEGGDKAASPAIFVYTLPNIVLGEICIHHKIQGENTFFVESSYNEEKMKEYAQLVIQNTDIRYCVYGWCEFFDNKYNAEFRLLERTYNNDDED